MKTYFKFLSNIALLTLTVLSLPSCDNQEPEFICEKEGEITLKAEPYVKAIAEDDVTAQHSDSFIITIPGNDLMSVKVDYPYISVSSIFSNVSQKPKIAYLGTYGSIDDIPRQESAWEDHSFSSEAKIHDGGGYVATLATYNPFQREEQQWTVLFRISERNSVSGESLRISYRVYGHLSTNNDGADISVSGNNLMTVSADYPYISVNSIFSNVSQKPRIAYLGNFSSIDEIPLRQSAWQGYAFDTQAEIHDDGGYIVTLATYDPFQREDKLWIVAMWFRERSATSELRIVYKVYSQNDLLTFSK